VKSGSRRILYYIISHNIIVHMLFYNNALRVYWTLDDLSVGAAGSRTCSSLWAVLCVYTHTHTHTHIHTHIHVFMYIYYIPINILLCYIYKKKIVEWAPIALGSEYEHNRYIVCTPTTVIHNNNNTYT